MTNNNMYFVANWKMYGNQSSISSINNVIKLTKDKKFRKIRIVYCPPFTLLRSFVEKTKNSKIYVGAQNCHYEIEYGPHTGFINSKMIKDSGSKFVILGHSESRREGDQDKIINKKIKSALSSNLKIIFCIGETFNEKKNNQTKFVLNKQINVGLEKIKNFKNIIVAYEPVWSIGTGIIPKINDLEKQIYDIKKIIIKFWKLKNPKIIYGGSVNPKNIAELKKISSINGFLVGGASQNSKNFIDIIKKTIN